MDDGANSLISSTISDICSSLSSPVLSAEEECRRKSADRNSTNDDGVVNISSSSSSSPSEVTSEDDADSTFYVSLRKIKKSLDDNLKTFRTRMKRKKKLKSRKDRKKLKNATSTPATNGNGQSSTSTLLPGPCRATDRELEYKRKLEMVTQQLEHCRMEQIKREKKTKTREPVIIDIPDDMEFYNVKKDWIIHIDGRPEDWFNRFNTHPKLKITPAYSNWIQTRINEHFPQVLKVMFNKWMEIPTSKGHSLTASDILVCRLVCKSWKATVEKHLQESSLQKNDEHFIVVSTKLCSNSKFKDMVNSLAKNRVMQEYNPFPSRDLVVSLFPQRNDRRWDTIMGAVKIILNRYGEHLHSFSFCGDEAPNSFYLQKADLISCWTDIRNWLKKMTNLKSLELSFPPSFSTISDIDLDMKYNRFPGFSNLIAIKCRRVPKIIVDSMFSANPQIEGLTILSNSDEEELNWKVYNECSRIFELSLEVSKVNHAQTFSLITWPLKKLILFTARDESIGLKILFLTLEKFGGTLTDVSLDMRVCAPPEEVLSLELPHLKNLSVSLRETSGNKISYDFMLPLIALQKLKITMEYEYDTGQVNGQGGAGVQVIQLRGFMNRLYESNLWKIFPHLKKVDATVYSDEDYAPKQYKYGRVHLKL